MYSALTVCSSNGQYFGVCSLPDCTEDVGPGLHAERFSVSVADGSLNYWGKEGTRKPKPQKETNKTGKKKKKRERERKSLSDQLEGEVMKFSLQYLCSEILQYFDKRTMNLSSGPSQTPVGLQQLESGLEHVLGRVYPWKAREPQGLRHWRQCVPVCPVQSPAWGCVTSTL